MLTVMLLLLLATPCCGQINWSNTKTIVKRFADITIYTNFYGDGKTVTDTAYVGEVMFQVPSKGAVTFSPLAEAYWRVKLTELFSAPTTITYYADGERYLLQVARGHIEFLLILIKRDPLGTLILDKAEKPIYEVKQ